MESQNITFVSAAYILSWAVLLGYLLRVHRALAKARTEYETASSKKEVTP
jgi:hypothetical protein